MTKHDMNALKKMAAEFQEIHEAAKDETIPKADAKKKQQTILRKAVRVGGTAALVAFTGGAAVVAVVKQDSIMKWISTYRGSWIGVPSPKDIFAQVMKLPIFKTARRIFGSSPEVPMKKPPSKVNAEYIMEIFKKISIFGGVWAGIRYLAIYMVKSPALMYLFYTYTGLSR